MDREGPRDRLVRLRVAAANEGAHGQFAGDPVPFVRDGEKLSRWLVTQ